MFSDIKCGGGNLGRLLGVMQLVGGNTTSTYWAIKVYERAIPPQFHIPGQKEEVGKDSLLVWSRGVNVEQMEPDTFVDSGVSYCCYSPYIYVFLFLLESCMVEFESAI